MVRITAIKINLLLIRTAFICAVLISIALILNILLLPKFCSTISNINTNFFINAIKSTIIVSNYDLDVKPQVDINRGIKNGIEYIIGFDIKRPQSILGYQLSFISNYDEMTRLEQYITSNPSVEENNNINVTENSKEQEDQNMQAEITPKQSVVKASGVSLINETNYNIELNSIISQNLKFNKSDLNPQVLIYHTHTCESYAPSQKYKYNPTDTDRTVDPNFSVVRVGEELTQILKNQYKISVIHDNTIHDGDSYNRAYTKSLKTVQGYIKKYPSIGLVIDLHRDAANVGDKKMRVATNINGNVTAQVMTVVGSEGSGLPHPNWNENLKLGVKFAKKINELYPGLSRGVDLKTGRFNQYLSPNAILVEVGANGNTLDEALNSTKCIAEAISDTLKNSK